MTDKKCPKCGSKDFQISEFETIDLIYEVEDGVVTACGQGDSSEHVRTVCSCRKCGHRWHPKNFEYTIDN